MDALPLIGQLGRWAKKRIPMKAHLTAHTIQSVTIALLLSLLAGCAGTFKSAPDFMKISVGMTEAEVVRVIGRPKHVAAEGSRKLFAYEWDDLWDGAPAGKWAYVGFDEGRVLGYFVDHAARSTSYNIAAAWTQIQSAPRTNISVQQSVSVGR